MKIKEKLKSNNGKMILEKLILILKKIKIQITKIFKIILLNHNKPFPTREVHK